MGRNSCLGRNAQCYSVAPVTLGEGCVVSQDSFLCTASHDYEDPAFRLVTAAISVEPEAWIAAGAFVGPGVTVGRGAVLGARAVVFKDVPAWAVVAGNPAVLIKYRRLRRQALRARAAGAMSSEKTEI